MTTTQKIKSFLIFKILLIGSISVQANTAKLSPISAEIYLRNDVPNVEFTATAAETYLICSTSYKLNFLESSREDNVVYPKAIIDIDGVLEPESVRSLSVQFQNEESVSAPSKLFYDEKNCELGLALSFQAKFNQSGKMENIDIIYGLSTHVNYGVALLNSKSKDLIVNDNFASHFYFKTKYRGTRYSPEEKKQVPYCTVSLYRESDDTEVGFTYLSVSCP